MSPPPSTEALRRVVALVAMLNLAYFGVEFAVATRIGSVALFADSIDFLEDAAINLLIVLATRWSPVWRARVGRLLAIIILVPTLAALGATWAKLQNPVAPAAVPLTLTGLGALAVNLTCAAILARHRHARGSLTKAAWLSARNDAVANLAIIVAGALTAATGLFWPDLVTGLGIAAMNADAAREVWSAAAQEEIDAPPLEPPA